MRPGVASGFPALSACFCCSPPPSRSAATAFVVRTPPSSPALTPPQPPRPAPVHSSHTVYAHNILLRKGPQFRIYIRWIRGQMLRTRHDVDPSFDDPSSFVLLINKGVIVVHLQDLADFLNSGSANTTPLKNISIQSDGNEIEIHGTVHKAHLPAGQTQGRTRSAARRPGPLPCRELQCAQDADEGPLPPLRRQALRSRPLRPASPAFKSPATISSLTRSSSSRRRTSTARSPPSAPRRRNSRSSTATHPTTKTRSLNGTISCGSTAAASTSASSPCTMPTSP